MVTGTGETAAAGSEVTSSSASAAHARVGTSLIEALLRGGRRYVVGVERWPGICGPPGARAKGGDANGNNGRSLRDCISPRQAKTRANSVFTSAGVFAARSVVSHCTTFRTACSRRCRGAHVVNRDAREVDR